jgi:UDP-glucose 4-epimerase
MKKILVTGNSGYIGSHLSKLLTESGYEVHGLDLNLPEYKPYKHYRLNVKRETTGFQQFDCIVHLAALVQVGESKRSPSQYYKTNTLGTINMLSIPHDNFIFASTGCAPACESPYAISKLAAEQCIEQLARKNYTIFRFYNVIGSSGFAATNPDGLMSQLVKAKENGKFTIYGTDYNTKDGTAVRDYVHVDEICKAIALAIETPANSTENLGHGQGYTVREIVDQFQSTNRCNFEVLSGPRRQGDLESSVLDKPSRYIKKLYDINQLLAI